jgi:hypothetical protein
MQQQDPYQQQGQGMMNQMQGGDMQQDMMGGQQNEFMNEMAGDMYGQHLDVDSF